MPPQLEDVEAKMLSLSNVGSKSQTVVYAGIDISTIVGVVEAASEGAAAAAMATLPVAPVSAGLMAVQVATAAPVSIRQLYKSNKHREILNQIMNAEEISCSCHSQSCDEILSYAIKQKKKKMGKAGLDIWPVPFGLGNIWRVGSFTVKQMKATTGNKRREMATRLYNAARPWKQHSDGRGWGKRKPCAMALAIIEELFRDNRKYVADLSQKPESVDDLNNQRAKTVVGRTGKPRTQSRDDKAIEILFDKLSSG